MSQYTQLNGDMPFGFNDFRYVLHLLSSVYLDLTEIVKRGATYTMSRAQLINDKLALLNDALTKWHTIGTTESLVKRFPALAPEFLMKQEFIAQMLTTLKNITPEQETAPETFPPYVVGRAFCAPPQAMKGLFSEPSAETLSKLLASTAVYVTEQQRKEIASTGGVITGRQTKVLKDGVVTAVPYVEGMYDKENGVPALALAAGAIALFLLNR